jgi:hypothetical protein
MRPITYSPCFPVAFGATNLNVRVILPPRSDMGRSSNSRKWSFVQRMKVSALEGVGSWRLGVHIMRPGRRGLVVDMMKSDLAVLAQVLSEYDEEVKDAECCKM